MIDLVPLGDRAYLARFASEAEALAWSAAARADLAEFGRAAEVVLAFRAVATFADPDAVDLDTFETRLRAIAPAISGVEPTGSGRPLTIPVVYDGQDLAEVADRLGLDPSEVVSRHSGALYRVAAIGFLPGFPYAGPLPDALAGLPRREAPRPRVPAGSVAIVGNQTGIYPQVSPGGWHLIGRTPLRIVDLEREHFPIRAGDRLRFLPIGLEEYERRSGDLLEIPGPGEDHDVRSI